MANKSNTKEIIQKVRLFLGDIKWKTVLTFLFFVLLASIFWVMQIYRQKFEATQIIHIKYINIPDSILFVSEMPCEISARYKDDGINLFKYYFTKQNDSLEVNVESIITNAEPLTIQGGLMEQLIKSKLLPSSELLSYYPSYMSFQYTPLNDKLLPVIYDGYIKLSRGHIIDGELKINPENVKAYGSKEALDTLMFAHTVADTLNIVGDKTVSVKIGPIDGVRFVPDVVMLTVPVDEFTEKELSVTIKCTNLPKNVTARFFPPVVKIPVFVGLKHYKDISADGFDVVVDYNDIKNMTEPTIAVRILKSPDFVKTKPPIPSEVEFILEDSSDN